MRSSKEKIVSAKDLVPGDIILISVGDRIPADSYLLEQFDIKIDESSLSGESTPVSKEVSILPEDIPVADRKNIVHTITTVIHGRAKAVVFATGMNTELGKIAGAIQHIETMKTPFEIRMTQVGKVISLVMLAVVGIISLIGYLQGHDLIDMLIWGISLAVAAVPEALPAVIVASLTMGVYSMAKRNAIIKAMPSVETLGSTTVICSDKTGTLTSGEMTVRKVYLYEKTAKVTGAGYGDKGEILGIEKDDRDLVLLAKTACLCNDSNIEIIDEKPKAVGDPTESALVVFAKKVGLVKESLDSEFPRISEVQFSSERKRMTTIHPVDNSNYAYMKGAAETVLGHCTQIVSDGKLLTMDDKTKEQILSQNNQMASDGLRVLAFAYKKIQNNKFDGKSVESNLVFIGLLGMMDPPRTEAVEAVRLCKKAGIDVKMITGDHLLTAESIAKEMGISGIRSKSMSGIELDKIDIKTLEREVDKIDVFARVSPEHKTKIVKALKNRGNVVAMTGDGINDAPSLRTADIGISMGLTGTQVTKEASSMILSDDNFATIVSAIKEGRRVMDNVKKYLVYLLPSNIGELILFSSSVMLGMPLPLLAKHVLFVNLVTDGAPAMALAAEPAEPDIMKRKPRRTKEGLFHGTWSWFLGISLIIGILSVLIFWYVLEINEWSDYGIAKARTMLFVFLMFEELFLALSCRSLKNNLTSIGFLTNKPLLYALLGEFMVILIIMHVQFLMDVFFLVSLGLEEWVLILLLAPATLVFSEILKIFQKFNERKKLKLS